MISTTLSGSVNGSPPVMSNLLRCPTSLVFGHPEPAGEEWLLTVGSKFESYFGWGGNGHNTERRAVPAHQEIASDSRKSAPDV